MAITYRTSAAGGATSGSTNRTVTIAPAVGDLIVVGASVSGTTNDAPTCTDNNGGTYDLIQSVAKNTSADRLYVFVRTALMPNTTSTIITVGSGSNTAGEVVAVACSGSLRVGSAAVRQSNVQANQAAATTPAPVFSVAARTGNMTLGFVANTTNPATLTQPTGWTERQDVGQSTPNTGLHVVTRDSGFTGTTVTWGSTSGSAYASVVVELDRDPPPIAAATGAYTVTGTTVALRHANKFPADTGSLTLTGTAVGVQHGYKVAAATGSYTITGTAVAERKDGRLAAATGSYVVGGQSVAVRAAHKTAAAVGSYALTGTAVDLSYTASTVTVAPGQPVYYLPWFLVPEEFVEAPVVSPPSLSAQGDTYVLTGSAVTLARSLAFAAATGSYTITGTDVGTTYTPVPAGVNPAVPAYYWLRGLTPEDVAPVMSQAYTVSSDSGSYTITGTAVGLRAGYKEAVGTGSYTLAGTPVGLRAGVTGVIDSGSYALSGQNVALSRTKQIVPAAGAYSLSGTAVRLATGFRAAIVSGAYSLAGTAVRLAAGLRSAIASGAYTLTGTAVGLAKGRLLAVEPGSYATTGTVVSLRAAHRIATATGAYALTGQTVSLVSSGAGNKLIDVAAGGYVLTGQSVGFRRTVKFPAGSGSFALSGQTVGLSRQLRTAVNVGTYLIGGQSAGLYWKPRTAVGAGVYAFGGQSVGLYRGFPFAAGSGSYGIGGEDVELVPERIIRVEGGPYVFEGQDINLLFSGFIAPPDDSGTAFRPDMTIYRRVVRLIPGVYGRIVRGVPNG